MPKGIPSTPKVFFNVIIRNLTPHQAGDLMAALPEGLDPQIERVKRIKAPKLLTHQTNGDATEHEPKLPVPYSPPKRPHPLQGRGNITEEIFNYIKRRPSTMKDVANALPHLKGNSVMSTISRLRAQGRLVQGEKKKYSVAGA